MAPPSKEKQRRAAALSKKKHIQKTHIQRLKFYAVVAGVVSLLMTIVHLVISLTH